MSLLADDRVARACHRCGYSLAGLASEGRCPECGERYDSGAVPVWLDSHAVPHCNRCGFRLIGLPRKGNCPGCGEWYSCARLVMAPGFRRAQGAIGRWLRAGLASMRPSVRAAAILLLIFGNTAIIVGLGWYAYQELLKVVGP